MNLSAATGRLFYYLSRSTSMNLCPLFMIRVLRSIRSYSEFFITPQNAAYLTIDHPERMEESIRNAVEGRSIELIVVTDAKQFLGSRLGNQWRQYLNRKADGPYGCRRNRPPKVLPVVLDSGTVSRA